MPRGNGTGPIGGGRGQGYGRGQGAGQRQGRMGGRFVAGPGGNCICPNCGTKVSHALGQPCSGQNCPKCGTRMTRET